MPDFFLYLWRNTDEAMYRKRKEAVYTEIGKFLIDVSKLFFGGVILTTVMDYEWKNPLTVVVTGIAAVLLCFLSGLVLISLSKKEEV